MKILLAILNVMCFVYFAADKALHNETVRKFITSLENSYATINTRVSDSSIRNGLKLISQVYSLAAILLFVCIVLFSRFGLEIFFWFSIAFSISIVCKLSIDWHLEHKKVIKNIKDIVFFVIGGVGVLILVDMTTEIHVVGDMLSQILKSVPYIKSGALSNLHPILGGIGILVALGLVILAHYVISCLLLLPIFAFSVALVATPIKFAGYMSRLNRDKPFAALMLFIGILLTISSSFFN